MTTNTNNNDNIDYVISTARLSHLKFFINSQITLPYMVELDDIAVGKQKKDLAPVHRKFWRGDYSGRPLLAFEWAAYIKTNNHARTTYVGIKSAARTLSRCLDDIDPDHKIRSVKDMSDILGYLLGDWLDERGYGSKEPYKWICSFVASIRSKRRCKPLLWPSRSSAEPSQIDPVETVAAQSLYRTLKDEAEQIKKMFAKGEQLAARGFDPRGKKGKAGTAGWQYRENHAFLMRELTRDHVLSRHEFFGARACRLGDSGNVDYPEDGGPEYLAPGMPNLGAKGGFGRKLRWFHPAKEDTAIFLLLFMIGTGWNLSTALAIDIDDFVDDHPSDPRLKVIHSFKARADRHQFTISLAKPEWHPYRILTMMIERTKQLRCTVQLHLADAESRFEKRPSHELEIEIAVLKQRLKSPWLYHTLGKTGDVKAFEPVDSFPLNEVLRATIIRHGLEKRHPKLMNFTTADARDAWIGYAYRASGYNILIAWLASQHANLKSLKHYLLQRRFKLESEQKVRQLQDALFEQIKKREVVDPTKLRILLQEGEITEQQELRLKDLRHRTRLGMGCLDPFHPPRNIDPDHSSTELCVVQRCIGCLHGVVFAESLEPLARNHAELLYLQRTMPLPAWLGSSFPEEEEAIRLTLEQFDQQQVENIRNNHLEDLKTRKIAPHAIHPL